MAWGSNNTINAAPTFLNGMCGYANVTSSFNANTGPALNAWTAADASGKGVQTGWVYTRRGTGGRAGRKQQEVLVTLAAVSNTQPAASNSQPQYVNTGLS